MNTIDAATLILGVPEGALAARGGARGVTYLYQKVSATGEHLKFGITNNPVTRYTAEELAGGRLRIIASGLRQDMLRLSGSFMRRFRSNVRRLRSSTSRFRRLWGLFPRLTHEVPTHSSVAGVFDPGLRRHDCCRKCVDRGTARRQ